MAANIIFWSSSDHQSYIHLMVLFLRLTGWGYSRVWQHHGNNPCEDKPFCYIIKSFWEPERQVSFQARQILMLWDSRSDPPPSQSCITWRVGNEVHKSTFLWIGPLRISLPPNSRKRWVVARRQRRQRLEFTLRNWQQELISKVVANRFSFCMRQQL